MLGVRAFGVVGREAALHRDRGLHRVLRGAEQLGEIGAGPGDMRLAKTDCAVDVARAAGIGHPGDQRRFGADHDEANGLRPNEVDHRGVIRRVEGDARRMVRDAGVAWRGIERIEGRRLRQFPRQCVFAAA